MSRDPSTPLFITGMVLMLSPPVLTFVIGPLAAYIVMWAGLVCLLSAVFFLLRTKRD